MPSLPHARCTVLCTVHRTVLWSSPPDNHPDQSGCSDEYNDVRVNRLSLAALRVLGKPLPTVLKDRIMDPIGASPSWSWNGYSTSFVDLNGERVQSVSGGGHWVRVAASLRARVCVCVFKRERESEREREREREREKEREFERLGPSLLPASPLQGICYAIATAGRWSLHFVARPCAVRFASPS